MADDIKPGEGQSAIPLPPQTEPVDAPPETSGAPRKRGRPRGSSTGSRKAPAADKAPRSSSAPRRRSIAQLQQQLTTTLVSGGSMLALVHAPDGLLVVQHAENVSAALCKVAAENPGVRDALDRMLTAGAWSGVVVAVLPLVVGIMANHGLVPQHLAQFVAPPPSEDGP